MIFVTRTLQGGPALFPIPFNGTNSISLGWLFYFSHHFSSLSVSLQGDSEKDCCKKTHLKKKYILGPKVKGAFTVIIENLPPGE